MNSRAGALRRSSQLRGRPVPLRGAPAPEFHPSSFVLRSPHGLITTETAIDLGSVESISLHQHFN